MQNKRLRQFSKIIWLSQLTKVVFISGKYLPDGWETAPGCDISPIISRWRWWKPRIWIRTEIIYSVVFLMEYYQRECTALSGPTVAVAVKCSRVWTSGSRFWINTSRSLCSASTFTWTVRANLHKRTPNNPLTNILELNWNTGGISSSSESLSYQLSTKAEPPFTGKAVILIIGGASESLECTPGSYRLLVKRRKGFVRLALMHGLEQLFCYNYNNRNYRFQRHGKLIGVLNEPFFVPLISGQPWYRSSPSEKRIYTIKCTVPRARVWKGCNSLSVRWSESRLSFWRVAGFSSIPSALSLVGNPSLSLVNIA